MVSSNAVLQLNCGLQTLSDKKAKNTETMLVPFKVYMSMIRNMVLFGMRDLVKTEIVTVSNGYHKPIRLKITSELITER